MSPPWLTSATTPWIRANAEEAARCSSAARTVIILYLNDSASLRKDAAKTDPCQVFARLVRSGSIGKDFDANLAQWTKARGERGRARSSP